MTRSGQPVLLAAVLVAVLTGCSGSASPDYASRNVYNPASDRMGALAGIPPESDVPSGGAVPNPAPFVDAGKLAGANAEFSKVKAAAQAYQIDHPAARVLVSDDLVPSYIPTLPNVRYHLSVPSSAVTRVDSVGEGWIGVVFSLSQQRWVKGVADRDHDADLDVP